MIAISVVIIDPCHEHYGRIGTCKIEPGDPPAKAVTVDDTTYWLQSSQILQLRIPTSFEALAPTFERTVTPGLRYAIPKFLPDLQQILKAVADMEVIERFIPQTEKECVSNNTEGVHPLIPDAHIRALLAFINMIGGLAKVAKGMQKYIASPGNMDLEAIYGLGTVHLNTILMTHALGGTMQRLQDTLLEHLQPEPESLEDMVSPDILHALKNPTT